MFHLSGYVQLLYLFSARKSMPKINKSTDSLENICEIKASWNKGFVLGFSIPLGFLLPTSLYFQEIWRNVYFSALHFHRFTPRMQICLGFLLIMSLFKCTFFYHCFQNQFREIVPNFLHLELHETIGVLVLYFSEISQIKPSRHTWNISK